MREGLRERGQGSRTRKAARILLVYEMKMEWVNGQIVLRQHVRLRRHNLLRLRRICASVLTSPGLRH